MTEPKEAKHSTFQVVTTMLTIFTAIFLAFSIPVLRGAWGDIKDNSHRLNGLTTQQALTKQHRVYMGERFNDLENNIEFLSEKMENIGKALNSFIISYNEKGQLVGHSQPKKKGGFYENF